MKIIVSFRWAKLCQLLSMVLARHKPVILSNFDGDDNAGTHSNDDGGDSEDDKGG